MLFFFRKSKTI